MVHPSYDKSSIPPCFPSWYQQSYHYTVLYCIMLYCISFKKGLVLLSLTQNQFCLLSLAWDRALFFHVNLPIWWFGIQSQVKVPFYHSIFYRKDETFNLLWMDHHQSLSCHGMQKVLFQWMDEISNKRDLTYRVVFCMKGSFLKSIIAMKWESVEPKQPGLLQTLIIMPVLWVMLAGDVATEICKC